MKEYYDILKRMEARPAMWTGELTLKSIRTFLDGYSYAFIENKLDDQSGSNELDFHDWIAAKLGFNESTAGWQNMILAYTIGLDPKNIRWEAYDIGISKELHEKSIKQFYALLEEYIEISKSDN